MQLLELTQMLLKTQAETLKRLAAFFGETACIELLESSGEKPYPQIAVLPTEWFKHLALSHNNSFNNSKAALAYQALEGLVEELRLPEVLEFHLWSYPPYRLIVESSIRLESKMIPTHAEALAEKFYQEAKVWFKQLPIQEAVAAAAEQVALIPWVRFKVEVLKKMGLKPFSLL